MGPKQRDLSCLSPSSKSLPAFSKDVKDSATLEKTTIKLVVGIHTAVHEGRSVTAANKCLIIPSSNEIETKDNKPKDNSPTYASIAKKPALTRTATGRPRSSRLSRQSHDRPSSSLPRPHQQQIRSSRRATKI